VTFFILFHILLIFFSTKTLSTHRFVAQPIRFILARPLFAKNMPVIAQLTIFQATHLKMDFGTRTVSSEMVKQLLGIFEFGGLLT
jgi:hypothetical protein